VHLVDAEVVFEQGSDKRKWRDKTVPKAEPETGDDPVRVGSSQELVGRRCAAGQKNCQRQNAEQGN